MPHLVELITMAKPKIKDATEQDKHNYLEILNKTGATVELNKKGGLKIKAPSSKKYRNIIKPLSEEKSAKDKTNMKLQVNAFSQATQMPCVKDSNF